MHTEAQALAAEIEAAAAALGISVSTVSERAGQGGMFYARIKAGKRVWPETIAKVRGKLAEMQSAPRREIDCDASHGDAPTPVQGDADGAAA